MRMPTTVAGRPAGASPGRPARLTALSRRGAALARTHWLLTALLVAGLVLRVLAMIAYRPSLLYIDSVKYIFGAYPGDDPPGYQLLIKPLLAVGNLDLVAAAQHLTGLAMAVVIYLLLQRRGVPRWLSALAAAPVLLDAYQIQIEQTIMPDVAFEAFIVIGLAALLWRPHPRLWLIVAAGLAFGASATARQVGEIFILPAVAYILIVTTGWRPRFANAAILIGAFALPILAASFRDYISPPHHFALAPYSSSTIYGRMAAAADCATLKLPYFERDMCPNAQQKLLGPDGLDHLPGSPIKTYYLHLPPGIKAAGLVTDFARHVAVQQPLRVISAIGTDAAKLFAVDRITGRGDTPIDRWQFQTHYPQYPPYTTVNTDGTIYFGKFSNTGLAEFIGTSEHLGGRAAVVTPIASFLRSYQLKGGYTPGPLLLFSVLAGLAGSVATLRRRVTPGQRDAARACLLFFTSAAAVLLISDVFEFSWRYQLPALVTLPPAAALGLLALFGGRRREAAGEKQAAQQQPQPGPLLAHADAGGAGEPGVTPNGSNGAGRNQQGPQSHDRARTS